MPRLSGIDMTKGCGIFIMLIVHTVTQNLAEYDGSVFYSLLPKIPSWLLPILIYPFVILGLFGTIFTLIFSMTTSFSMINICEKKEWKKVWPYLINKIIFCILLSLFEDIILSFTQFENEFLYRRAIFLPNINLVYTSTTLDSIGWSGVIGPFIVYLLYACKIKKPIVQVTILSVLMAVSFGISNFTTTWIEYLADLCRENRFLLFELLFSKMSTGRFKVTQTFGFMVCGAIFAIIYMKKEWQLKKLIYYNLGLTVVCIATFVTWACIDSSWLDHIVDEDVPLAGQILCLGLETEIVTWHIYFCDSPTRTNEQLLKSRRRTTYARRLGLLSLTAYCICSWVGKHIMVVFKAFLGPPCVHGEHAEFLWNPFYCLFFVIADLTLWFYLAYYWSKIHFKYSVEWALGAVLAWISGKSGWRMNSDDVVYGPIIEIEKKLDEKKPLLEEETIVVDVEKNSEKMN